MVVEIYYDAEQEVEWFISLDSRLESATRNRIQSRDANDRAIINDLIIYDRPDIILLVDGIPKLVLEKTEEVPSGHNVGQRIARLVRAVELNVPIVKFFPFLAMKHGAYASKCYVRPNIFLAFKKMTEFHNVHALALNWKCDDDGELIRDGSENFLLKRLIGAFIRNNFSFQNIPESEEVKTLMEREYATRMSSSVHYRELAPSLSVKRTPAFISELSHRFGNLHFNPQISRRRETLIYEISMTPQNCRREDPYTGTQFIYDYCYCRTDSTIENRSKNFVLHFPLITKERWIEANPLDRGRKSFLWYVLADFMIFKNGVLKRGDNFAQ